MASGAAAKPPSRSPLGGHMRPSEGCLGMLLECVQCAWEGPEDATSCARRFLACVGGAEQEEQLRRVLSFVEAVRGPLLERLEGCETGQGGDGVVEEEASRKRARGEAGKEQGDRRSEAADRRDEVGPKEGARPVLAASSSTATCAHAGGPSMHTHEGMTRATKAVLLDGDLLGCVWGYVLGGNSRHDVPALGRLSLVCRKWREVGAWDTWWEGIEAYTLPMLWEAEGASAGSPRGRVLEYGRFLEGQRQVFEEQGEEWLLGLEGHVEIFDRMDGLQMLSMRGPVVFSEVEGFVTLGFTPQVRGTWAPFSVASRDPLGRYARLADFVSDGNKAHYPSSLCIRVTLRDTRTGQMALVWEEDKTTDYGCFTEADAVCIVGHTESVPRSNLVGRMVHGARAYFKASPVAGQEQGSERQRLFHFPVSPDSVRIQFDDMTQDDGMSLGQLSGILRSALALGGSAGEGPRQA